MSRVTVARLALVALLAAHLPLGTGCASNAGASQAAPAGAYDAAPAGPAAMSVPGVQRTSTAVDGLNAMAQELGSARQTVDDALASLQGLSAAQGDLLAPFQRFIDLRQQLDAADQRLGERGDDMRARARDYITNWEVEVYGVEDPNLRQQAETRRSQVRENYGRIADATRGLRETMTPFRRQLEDLQTFLANDLTQAGVSAAKPSIERATQSGRQVQQRMGALMAELDRVSATMTPAVVAPAGGTTSPAPGAVTPRPAPSAAPGTSDLNK
jgi:hypothetical protein